VSEQQYSVLFIGTGNSARSIMAEAILRQRGHGRFVAYSAGSQPTGQVSPYALRQLQDARLEIDGLRSKSWAEFTQPGVAPLDFVFTLGDMAADVAHPVWPGRPVTAHWGVPDPAAVRGSDEVVARAFHSAFMALDWRIGLFICLPISALSDLALANRLTEIGTS